MADAPEIRIDSTPATSEAPVVAAVAATDTATASETTAAVDTAQATEAAAEPASPQASSEPAEPAAPASAEAEGVSRHRTSIAAATPASRTALVAGGLGFAAGIALLAGTVGAIGVSHLFAAPTASVPGTRSADETRVLKQSIAKLQSQVAGLKTSIEASNRQTSAQRAKVVSHYERSARTQAEMQTRLAKIGDGIERLEKRVAAVVASEVTGSVAPRYAAAAAGAPTAADAEEPPTPPKPPIAEGWVIRDVFRGRALVTSRRGAVFEAAPGLRLPRLGRVEAVRRENGRWVVVTENGIITTRRR